ncbi:MAG: hypothetical protein ABW128_17215 [Rhizorhabdus sp.]
MTFMDHAQHALGVLSLTVFAGAGGFSLCAMVAPIAPARPRMRAVLRGPVSPAASATVGVARIPQRRGVEAAAAPALQVRA